jgi:fatty acid desaturase
VSHAHRVPEPDERLRLRDIAAMALAVVVAVVLVAAFLALGPAT